MRLLGEELPSKLREELQEGGQRKLCRFRIEQLTVCPTEDARKRCLPQPLNRLGAQLGATELSYLGAEGLQPGHPGSRQELFGNGPKPQREFLESREIRMLGRRIAELHPDSEKPPQHIQGIASVTRQTVSSHHQEHGRKQVRRSSHKIDHLARNLVLPDGAMVTLTLDNPKPTAFMDSVQIPTALVTSAPLSNLSKTTALHEPTSFELFERPSSRARGEATKRVIQEQLRHDLSSLYHTRSST